MNSSTQQKLQPVDKEIIIALAGNPNCGKTSIFNNLTGTRQQVGNWPGVTVERKEGQLLFDPINNKVVDLPGTYSLGAYSEDEVVARDYIIGGHPNVIIDVIDASNIERNLYLTMQLLEAGSQVVVALNMLDEAAKNSIKIDVAALAAHLDLPVVSAVASKNEGMRELVDAALTRSHAPLPSPLRINYGKQVEAELTKLESLAGQYPDLIAHYPARYLAVKLIEGDLRLRLELQKIWGQAGRRLLTLADKSIRYLETIYGDDLDSLIVEQRYQHIASLIKGVVFKEDADKPSSTSDKIDRIVLNRKLAIPIFLLIMYGMFQLTFTLGTPLSHYISNFFTWLGGIAAASISSKLLASLVVNAIIGGVGSVLAFIPPIFLLFLVISLLEDSGYMARAAYITDHVMNSLGLHGKSFISLIVGFGCNVPAVMATRTLECKEDRMITMLISPLMSCSARLPVYVLFAGAFFTAYQGLVVFSLYLLGIILAIIVANIFKRYLFKSSDAPFVMELPPYRFPTMKATLIHVWDRGSSFFKKAGTVILAAAILVWVLANLPWGVQYASQRSLMGMIGGTLAPLLRPLGFGSWQAASSLLFGLVAKEVVVGTLGVVYGTGSAGLAANISQYFTPLSAYSFMVMTLLYSPCVPTIAAIRRESNSRRWTTFAVSYCLVLGWLMAFIVYQGGRLLGLS